MRRLLALATAALLAAGCREQPRLLLGSTHTLEDSGLLPHLAEAFQQTHRERRLSTVVAGSGEILAMARNGDLDVLITHSPEDETAFIAAGHGVARQRVMYNDFVLLGPVADAALAAQATDAPAALRRVQDAALPFISRGDDSGTHRRERALWADAQRLPEWPGYTEAGAGMADALRLAHQRSAYVLADRATWEALRSELTGLRIVHQGDARLRNQYSVIVATRARDPEGARIFAAWLRGPEAQQLILSFGTDAERRPLFHPDAQ